MTDFFQNTLPRPARCVADVQDNDAFIPYPIEDFVWITNQRDSMNPWSLLDSLGAQRLAADALDNGTNACFDRMRRPLSEFAMAVGS